MGVVCPIGVGAEAVWASLQAGNSGIRTVDELAAAAFPIPIAGLVDNFDAKEFVRPRKALKVMSRETQLGFAAAEMAWNQAQLEDSGIDPERLGVTIGCNMFCPELPELEPAYRAIDAAKSGKFDYPGWGGVGLREIFPLWLLKYLPNMAPAHVSIAHDARGPSNSIVAGDISATLAIIEAADVVARGHADVMIAGGASSNLAMMDLVWHATARRSRRVDEPQRACRPFDADRDGMVDAEGAAIFVLERREHAEARRARPLGRILGYGRRHEPAHDAKPPTGQAIQGALEAALRMASLDPSAVGHVNAHGLSTELDDRIEARAIAATLGDVPVTAPKSFVGNIGAGGGAVELAFSVIGLDHGLVPPTLNYETPDPACPVNVVTELAPFPSSVVAALSHRTTGQATALIVDVLT
jgi:3-oxoacyl-[acyl-carrier-protein] synthase II